MSNKLFHMISFPLQLLLYPPLHSKNHQDTPAFFLKFTDHPLESPLLPAALVCPTANIQIGCSQAALYTSAPSSPNKYAEFSECRMSSLISSELGSYQCPDLSLRYLAAPSWGMRWKERVKISLLWTKQCICSRKKSDNEKICMPDDEWKPVCT